MGELSGNEVNDRNTITLFHACLLSYFVINNYLFATDFGSVNLFLHIQLCILPCLTLPEPLFLPRKTTKQNLSMITKQLKQHMVIKVRWLPEKITTCAILLSLRKT